MLGKSPPLGAQICTVLLLYFQGHNVRLFSVALGNDIGLDLTFPFLQPRYVPSTAQVCFSMAFAPHLPIE